MNEDLKIKYLHNPCETLATAFWKEQWFTKPEGISISLDKDITSDDSASNEGIRYFRLIHHLLECRKAALPDGYVFRNVLLPDEATLVADVINQCYDGYSQTQENVLQWTKHPVFDNKLWIFICEANSSAPAALGIADFDPHIKEGSLEWIQVLPAHRGKGLGEALVLELLSRLKDTSGFVTVSGEVENAANPERLYRKCGFTGDAVWVVNRRC